MQRPGETASFVGREAVLATLTGQCLAGEGGLTVLTGEAGSGKSRLLAELETRAAAAGVPVGFAGIVHHKAALLPREDRAVIVVAALLGQEIRWDLLPAATATDRSHVAASIRAGTDGGLLTVDAARTPRWRHALTREALLAALSTPERADLAATVVDRLDSAGTVERDPALLADLHARAGHPHRAAELLRRLAAAHVRAGALTAGLDVLERVIVLAAGDAGLTAAVRVDHVRALALAARIDDTAHVERRPLSAAGSRSLDATWEPPKCCARAGAVDLHEHADSRHPVVPAFTFFHLLTVAPATRWSRA